MAAAAEAETPVRRIAVFLQNRARLGTLVCHIPLISSLRRHYPAAHLTIVAPFAEASLLVADGLADALRPWPRSPWAQARLVRGLAADVLLTLRPNSTFITLLVGLSGARARLGFDTPLARLLLSSVAPRDLTIYRPLNYLQLVESLGVAPALSAYLEEAAGRVPAAIDPNQENVCLMPGGASPFKLWGIDNFLALAARLRSARPGARFVFVLGPGERALHEQIDASPLAAVTTVLDTPSLGAIAQAVLASRVTVANDCGPSHVAQLLGRPYVCVFANHRGQAERIARQWFFPRPGARWLSGPAGAPITDLAPIEVARCVEEVWPAEVRRDASGGTTGG
ncbi:MAG TPA: glycosyltransferase family 9 protein [Candidatus Dormibacteraeota bacterium]|nr:glycosyltransferase family 9 protein [Candidatus Dormibacteraeota bacterium]